jgi:hypothetical protein
VPRSTLRPLAGADSRGRLLRLAVKELLLSDRTRVIPDGPGPACDDPQETAAVVLDRLAAGEPERATHGREVFTGFRSGSGELPAAGEPRADWAAGEPTRVSVRGEGARVRGGDSYGQAGGPLRQDGEAGLVPARSGPRSGPRAGEVWSQAALEAAAWEVLSGLLRFNGPAGRPTPHADQQVRGNAHLSSRA